MTNSLSGGAVSGATVITDPAVSGVSIQTGSDGKFSVSLPIGTYTLTFEKDLFTSATQTVSVVAGQTVTSDVALEPASPVVVSAGADQTGSPGEIVSLKVTATPLDGSRVTGYKWEQTGGATAIITSASSATTMVTLADATAYKAELFGHLANLDRFMVQGINPHSLEEAEAATFKVTVTTTSGSYSDTVKVMADLPYAVSSGIQSVPVGVPVLLHGKAQDIYDWSLTSPAGSSASLDDTAGQNPSFTPDVAGQYTLTEANSGATIDVYAGTWAGAISGQDANGRPLSANCTGCHNGTVAPDKFTAWKGSGHAEIFTANLNTSTHYGEHCFTCHTVGFDKAVANGGIDEASDYADFLAAGLINHPSPDNWSTVLASYPNTARLANIQCENCHGPNTGSTLHLNGTIDSARVSIASDACATCHGEPPRHGRFQQWEESKHGDYTLAISRGTSSHCGRCHSGQGYLAWLPQLKAGNPGNIEADITWTAETAHPVTCVVCHDPHEQGTTSGEPNTATVRVEGDTPMLPAGFKAVGVGRGALCMTCHNTRNGAHNDVVTTEMNDRAPHVAAQADLLMGENAYFVGVGDRSPHSFIEDSCTNCHMEQTNPPAELSYNLGGTNHTFEASHEICTNCHGAFKGEGLEKAVEALLEELKADIEGAIITEITAQTNIGRKVVLKGVGEGGADVEITDGSDVTAVELTEYHGRIAMNITVGGTTYEHIRLASDTTVKTTGGIGIGTLLTSSAGQTIAKAAWNYFLVHGDGSHGIHNPSFTTSVLKAAIDALK